MNYLLAIIFIIATSIISAEIKRQNKNIDNLNYDRYFPSMIIGTSILIAMLMAQFVLIANGFARLMNL